MNERRWKFAFWITFATLLLGGIVSAYALLDNALTMTYMREGYADTEEDLKTLSTIAERARFTKSEFDTFVAANHNIADMKSDTISLERVQLIFENDTLRKAEFQW